MSPYTTTGISIMAKHANKYLRDKLTLAFDVIPFPINTRLNKHTISEYISMFEKEYFENGATSHAKTSSTKSKITALCRTVYEFNTLNIMLQLLNQSNFLLIDANTLYVFSNIR